ncbi:hypothetical protein FHS52_002644 [Erythromicrobium ramosum]|uniref:Uncharacterized protein n=1 Tax=Erythrobacter ramosus TaxID=35811 RepID=A0ABR6I1C4_9SPHN|nr:hypothetical protein [Erythrobacter ramosus]MBB3776652.1 hypothetical protein [Erythrobacter ramosus]
MLIEGLGTATIVNGMMRIETLYRNAKGADVSGPELLIPVARVAAVAQGLQVLLDRAEEAAKAQPADAEPN